MAECAEWGELDWGDPWGETAEWGERLGGDIQDESASLVAIAVGCLDFETTALHRVYKQFELDEDGWIPLATLLGQSFQEVENTLAQVAIGRYVSTAVGVQLEAIGEAVGRPRGQLVDDEDYRLAIIVDAMSLYSSGTIPEIIDLVVRLLGPQYCQFREFYPAAFRVRGKDISQARFNLLVDILRDVPPAGVGAVLSTVPVLTTGGWGSLHVPDEDILTGLEFDPDLRTLIDRISAAVGTPTGTTYDTPGDARVFVGTTDIVKFPAITDLAGGGCSGSMFVQLTSTAAGQWIFTTSETGGDSILFGILAGGALIFRWNHTGTDLRSDSVAGVVSAGVVHQIGWSFPGGLVASDVQLFVDGVEVSGYSTQTDATGTPAPTDNLWALGGKSLFTPGGMDGVLRDAWIWSRDVADQEYERHYHQELIGGRLFTVPLPRTPIPDLGVWGSIHGVTSNPRAHWSSGRGFGK